MATFTLAGDTVLLKKNIADLIITSPARINGRRVRGVRAGQAPAQQVNIHLPSTVASFVLDIIVLDSI